MSSRVIELADKFSTKKSCPTGRIDIKTCAPTLYFKSVIIITVQTHDWCDVES